MATIEAGNNFMQKILTYGYPTPTFTLRKKVDSSYTNITGDSRITLSAETISITTVEPSDSGDYQLVATNEHGNYLLNFTLSVSGTPVNTCMHMYNYTIYYF